MRIDHYDSVANVCKEIGKTTDLYFIARIQNRKDLTIRVNNGKLEEVNTGTLAGMGIQVFNPRGYMGFAASDQLSEDIAAELFHKAAFLAGQSEAFGGEPNQEVLKLKPLQQRIELQSEFPYGSLSLEEIEERVTGLNSEIAVIDPRLSVQSLLRLTDEEWRVIRADGTDVSFNTPRAFIYHIITAKSGSETATTIANLPGRDLEIIISETYLNRLRWRAQNAAALALKLLAAKNFPGGNYKLVIDYPLAKGLAHEAFGHAVETDGLERSILGENGRLKTGILVANPKLSIIDQPVEGDYAYQPISAMGTKREKVTIVDHGRLMGGLADIFSAAGAGVPATGAERVENFFHLPIARMSNIRIEVDNPVELDREFESATPSDVYRILQQHNLMKSGETVLLLTGYQGGQVNPAFGDFVFHCSGIYILGEEPVLYKPAIFSGKILSVLNSISGAIGPLQIDAMGTCGKMGQSVPSSGGAHYFLIIEKNSEIMVGGE
jgi:TldD protein